MACRGVRGATTVERNDREEILTATRQLLALMIRRNAIDKHDVASAIFTTTPDLDARVSRPGGAATRLARCAALVQPRALRARLAAALHSRARALEHGPRAKRDRAHLRPRRRAAAAGPLQAPAGELGRARIVDQRANARARAVVSTFTSCWPSAPEAASARAARDGTAPGWSAKTEHDRGVDHDQRTQHVRTACCTCRGSRSARRSHTAARSRASAAHSRCHGDGAN